MRVRTRQPLNLSAPEETSDAITIRMRDAAQAADDTTAETPADVAPTGIEPATVAAEPAPTRTRAARFGRSARVTPPPYRTEDRVEAPVETAEERATGFNIPEPTAPEPVDVAADEPLQLDAAEAEAAVLAEPAAEPAASPAEPAPVQFTLPDPGLAEPQPIVAPVAAAGARRREKPARPPARFAYFLAAVAAAVWVAGVVAFVIGYEGGVRTFDYTPFHMTVLTLLALAPLGLLFSVAYVVRQGSRLAEETRRAHGLSESMVAPAALASNETAAVVRQVRSEIDEAVAAAARAREELSVLKDALALQTRELTHAADYAARTARTLQEQLGGEREKLGALSGQLETQAEGMIAAVERQTSATAEISDLAQAQLREAEAALTARAADLAAAAGEASDAARLAADDLARQTIRLETAGTGVAEQIRSVEDGLSQQRAALVQAGYALRTDQEDFSAQVETQRAQLAEALVNTQSAVAELNETSARGAEMLSSLVVETAAQAKVFADLTSAERDAFAARTKETLDRFAAMAAQARTDLLEETRRALASLTSSAESARKAADEAADAAQARIDNLGEAAFDAARRADEAFESRLTAARTLFEQSSALIDEAGERASRRIESNMTELRSALAHIDEALAEIDGRAARLPSEAKARIEEIRASVEQGLDSLATSARKAAEETQAVDAAFQERVKRNYDMLSEAVKLMGLVSGGSPAPRPRLEPEAEQPRRREAQTMESPLVAPAPTPAPAAAGTAAEAGLRGRLKLTPTASDEEFRQVFDSATAKPSADSWTWRDLLGGMSGSEPAAPAEPEQDDALADTLIDEIHRLGVDPNALLPRSRVEAAAEALHAGNPDGAREIVRRVAPAAARRISRRVLTDPALRAQTERYMSLFEARIVDAVRRDPEGFMTASLLGSEAGRTYLLIDAAIGDV